VSEVVAIYDLEDPAGRVVGTAPRARMRAQNLPHAATAVIVRKPTGEIFVHRRADTKDIWPGRHDCAAGGVLQAGEDPDEAAARELAEEIGIEGAVLVPLVQRWYLGPDTTYFAYAYVTTWDGPVRFADGEVAEGWWEDPSVLYDRLKDTSWPFVPDTRALLDLPDTRALLLGEQA
jgi:8-oxo-dGTP pyrophosphatase MutT (NUDIX family)